MSRTSFTPAERQRFRNLLELAERTQFEGERSNAIGAARRMAERRGMSLEEAARDAPPVPDSGQVVYGARPDGPARPEPRSAEPNGAEYADHQGRAKANPFIRGLREGFARQFYEKMARDESRREAYDRGLDAAERRAKRPRDRMIRRNPRRRDPAEHAATLLSETQLSFLEIAAVTGLDVYNVVGLKLKLRGRRNMG